MDHRTANAHKRKKNQVTAWKSSPAETRGWRRREKRVELIYLFDLMYRAAMVEGKAAMQKAEAWAVAMELKYCALKASKAVKEFA